VLARLAPVLEVRAGAGLLFEIHRVEARAAARRHPPAPVLHGPDIHSPLPEENETAQRQRRLPLVYTLLTQGPNLLGSRPGRDQRRRASLHSALIVRVQ